jgi:hypothetical protein
VDADYKSVEAKGPIRNQLDHKGLTCPRIFCHGTHLDPFGLISGDAVYKSGYNAANRNLTGFSRFEEVRYRLARIWEPWICEANGRHNDSSQISKFHSISSFTAN